MHTRCMRMRMRCSTAAESCMGHTHCADLNVNNLRADRSWSKVGELRPAADRANGALQRTGTPVWPGSGAALAPVCFASRITIGALYATGFGPNYDDAFMYNAVQVALRRIQRGLAVQGPEGTLVDSLLPNTELRLLHHDTALVSAVDEMCVQGPGTGADPRDIVTTRLKQKALNESVRALIGAGTEEADEPVALLGITWSSEGVLSGEILSEVERVVISPSATSPALTPYPWFARYALEPCVLLTLACGAVLENKGRVAVHDFIKECACWACLIYCSYFCRTVANDAAQGEVLAKLVKHIGVKSCLVVACTDVYCQGLVQSVNASAIPLGIEAASVDLEQFRAQLGTYLNPDCNTAEKPVIILAMSAAQAIDTFELAVNEGWDWTEVIWIGSESVSGSAQLFPDFIGVRLAVATESVHFKQLEEFWKSEAQDLPGVESLHLCPYVAAAHDSLLAVAVAAHELISSGLSQLDGPMIRDQLSSVGFFGASGYISFSEQLDLATPAYAIVQTQAFSKGEGEVLEVGNYRRGLLALLETFQTPSLAMEESATCKKLKRDRWVNMVLVPALVVPIVVLVLVAIWLYVRHIQQKADAVWRISRKEIVLSEPLVTLGKGSYGVVVKAEYRGTAVAVKRLLPPANKKLSRRKLSVFDSVRKQHARDALPASENGVGGGGGVFCSIVSMARQRLADGLSLTGLTHACLCFASLFWSTVLQVFSTSDVSGMTSSEGGMHAGSRSQESGSDIEQGQQGSRQQSSPESSHSGGRNRSLLTDFMRELRMVSHLRHPCITTVMGAVVEAGEEMLLVMELMEHGSLQNMLQNQSLEIDGELIHPMLQNVIQGMRFLHASQPVIVHGDLKSANVLVDRNFRAKVTDFGLARKGGRGRTKSRGTPYWIAPEVLNGEENTPASDVYAFGIMLWEIYARQSPYAGEDVKDVLKAVQDLSRAQDKRPVVVPSFPAPMVNTMVDCWHKDAALRPSFAELDRRISTLSPDACEPASQVGASEGSLSVVDKCNACCRP